MADSDGKDKAASPNVDILIDGKEASDDHFQAYVVDRDMFQPAMAAITLANQGDVDTPTKSVASMKIRVENDKKTVFRGEPVGLEPVYAGGQKTVITLRAMNK